MADETGGPSEVDSYHSLHPLEPVAQDLELRRLFGHTSTCYRATSSKDGLFYCLRRLHGEQSLVEVSWECVCVSAGVRLTTHKSVQQFDKWRKVEHSSLVSLREMFTTKAFGDNCETGSKAIILLVSLPPLFFSAAVVFVYDYLPGAETLDSRHLQGGRRARALPESLLWDYIVQLAAAVRAVHTAGLALYTLDSTKILVTGSGRLASLSSLV